MSGTKTKNSNRDVEVNQKDIILINTKLSKLPLRTDGKLFHASHLINHGANIMIIAQRLGHADTTEIMNRYGHLYPSTQKEIVKYL